MSNESTNNTLQQQQVFFWLTMVTVALYALITIGYIIRILKLDKMASAFMTKRPKTLIPKLVGITILIILQLIHMLLAFFDINYWMHNFENYSLVDIFSIVTLVIQAYIIITQWKKNSLSMIPLIQWGVMLASDLATIIIVSILQPDSSILLVIFKAMIQIALVAISLWLDQPNVQKIPKQQNTLLPLMSNSFVVERNADRIYVQFNKQFEITIKDSQATNIVFKIAVYIGNNSTIIYKNYENFLKFHQQLSVLFPDDELISNFGIQLKKNSSNNSNNLTIMKYAEEKQKVCQNFLIQLSQNSNYYVNTFFDFLKVLTVNRVNLIEKRNKRLLKKVSLISEDQKSVSNQAFFTVQRYPSGKIHVYNEQILEIMVDKSRDQIIQFHDNLINQKILQMGLLSEESDQAQILHFIGKVANSKNLWRSFAQWLCLGKKTQDKIYNIYDLWNIGFKNLSISIIGYQIGFDQERSLHTLYLLSVCKKCYENKQIFKPQGKTLKKRYNDFVKLDKHIKKFMVNNKIKRNSELLQLPPKFSPFGSKTSPKSRQIYFNSYIKQLLSIQKINHCVKFLQFIQADSQQMNQSLNLIDQSFNSDLIGDLQNQAIRYQ